MCDSLDVKKFDYRKIQTMCYGKNKGIYNHVMHNRNIILFTLFKIAYKFHTSELLKLTVLLRLMFRTTWFEKKCPFGTIKKMIKIETRRKKNKFH